MIVDEMAEYEGEEMNSNGEEMNSDNDDENLRIFVICYNNGNLHSVTVDQDIAWYTARRINGIIGELTNVHRPKYLHEVAPPEVHDAIVASIDPKNRVKRERPQAA